MKWKIKPTQAYQANQFIKLSIYILVCCHNSSTWGQLTPESTMTQVQKQKE